MAAEVSSMPAVNGNYAPHSGYGGGDQQHNGDPYNGSHASALGQYNNPPPPATSSTPVTTASSQTPDIPKDEVGWYFVERYYTTLSGKPEKLYMFYNKRSQFVSGQETDKVAVCVGQRAINDRIKELDFHDCKVRVTNVDSQASDSNIVIQVIGEISNRGLPHRKFTQTFVLATQTNGYFVLNDIFRYLIEEEDEPEAAVPAAAEEVQQSSAAAEDDVVESAPAHSDEVEPKTLTVAMEPTTAEHDTKAVDGELEEKELHDEPKTEEDPIEVENGIPAELTTHQHEDALPAASVHTDETPSSELRRSTTEDADLKPEKVDAPEPNPATSQPKEESSQPAAPAKPKTWASLAASAHKATPVPAPTPSQPVNTAQPRLVQSVTKSSTPAPQATSATAPPSAPAAQRDEPQSANAQDEWTPVGAANNRQQSRQATTQQQDPPNSRGYIKNVQESVDADELKAHFEQYGEIGYFDVNRQRACAWVDFKTPESYNTALAANPHVLGSDRLILEERRKPNTGPFTPGRGGFNNGGPGRGRGNNGNNQGPQRGGYQNNRGGGGGGGFGSRGGGGGRGGAPAPRGRGGVPTPSAPA